MNVRPLQSPILVGRDQVLSRFEEVLAEAAAGRGSALLIAGEAGIGKSRLTGALVRQAVARGFRVARSELSPQDQLVPLASIRDLARAAPREMLGALGEASLSVGSGGGNDSLARRRILVHEVADRILAAIDQSTVVVFEDVHWADELGLEVIGELVRRVAGTPLLVVATYRPEDLPAGSIHKEWRARLLTQRLATEVILDRLTPVETAQMTTLILGTGLPAPREVVEAIQARTNGIPLHIEELIAALGDGASDGRAIRDAAVPSTIEDAILARSRRLSEDAQAVARAGAVIGRSFPPDVLAGILDRPVFELDRPLRELVDAGILNPFQLVDHGYYDFRHQLIRDALYQSVPPGELRSLHARVAEFGATLIGASEIHASVHFERAGMRGQAYHAALAGAEAAAAITSRYESFELYRRAVANFPEGLSPSELGDVWLSYCVAGLAIDDVPTASEAARNARRQYLAAGRPIDAVEALLCLAALARRDVLPAGERRAFLEQAEAELQALPPSRQRAAALMELQLIWATCDSDAARLATARQRLAEARTLLEEAEREVSAMDMSRLDVEFDLTLIDALEGDPEGALPRMLELSRTARAAQYESTGVTNYRITADMAARLMEYPTATIGIGEGLRYSDEIEQSYCRRIIAATSALVAWADGRWDEAVRVAELELVERGSRRGTLGSRNALGFVAFGRGDTERARSLLDASLAISRPSGEISLVLPALWGVAETALVDGDPARALDHCQEAIELAEPTAERALLVPFIVTAVRAALLDRRPEAAERWLDRITPLMSDWGPLAQPALEHANGLLKHAAGSLVAARESLSAAASGWDSRGRIWEATWARLDLAAALIRANRHGAAVGHLDDVLSTARALGSLPLLRRAEELERSARSRVSGREPWHPLSAREFEVARKIAEGRTNAEIGEELFISPKTVSAHVEHILAKLGVARRIEVAAWVATVARQPTDARDEHVGAIAGTR